MPPSASDPTPTPMQSPTPTPEQHSKLPIYMWIAAVAIVFAVGWLVYSLKTTSANADYICTKVISTSGNCTNGTWTNWTQTSQSTDANNVTTITYQRTYTGTRAVSKTLTYLNLRTQCQAGYTQSAYGSGGGASGFHGGDVTTTQSACQVVQSETVTKTVGPTGASSKWSITNAVTDLGTTTSTKTGVGSLAELDAMDTGANAGNGFANASGEIAVKPGLLRAGQTTTVTWTASGVDTCAVTSDGGDSWTGLTGTQVSKSITRQTTFTLTCPLNGTDLTSSAVVNVTPTFQEL